ncbi:hypothetical protein [Klebsiella pneumoniae ISC21]|nr:hypothetical protein [Klebsiella pneumoniae ISC21]
MLIHRAEETNSKIPGKICVKSRRKTFAPLIASPGHFR